MDQKSLDFLHSYGKAFRALTGWYNVLGLLVVFVPTCGLTTLANPKTAQGAAAEARRDFGADHPLAVALSWLSDPKHALTMAVIGGLAALVFWVHVLIKVQRDAAKHRSEV